MCECALLIAIIVTKIADFLWIMPNHTSLNGMVVWWLLGEREEGE